MNRKNIFAAAALLAPALVVLATLPGMPKPQAPAAKVAMRTYYLTFDGKVTTHRGAAQVVAKTRALNVPEARKQFAA